MTSAIKEAHTVAVTIITARKPITVRFSDEERKMLAHLAKNRQVPLTVALRLLVRDTFEKEQAMKKAPR